MAASRVAVLDDAYLGGDALRHGVGMADDAHLLALRRLEHCQRVDDSGERVGVERAETLVDEEVLERQVARRQGR